MNVSEAVAHAHQQNLIHRDLKPSNILLDPNNVPRIVDFGLAVHESTLRLRQVEIAGSPKFMSPEQVRGENHRLDGRSDIWSLGVILYQLLTGESPFQGRESDTLFDSIKNREPLTPQEHNRDIPRELERICLKCLSKRILDRYENATLLAKDLRRWLESESDSASSRSFSKPMVVPKGLRSFDEHDANFFLDLLPGPRDYDGLPESIRFWKTRIEDTVASQSFSVGLIYGPSGCGKSSLVKAGLLPRLSPQVLPVYLEASPTETEERLEKGIRKHLQNAPEDISLPDLVRGIREGLWKEADKKILIVLDQFEQWLHTHSEDVETDLLNALRHCFGASIQCVLLIRDDFWLATSRFMRALEINLVEGSNQMLVDLFDPLHAKKVLIKLGRAFDRLPTESSEFTDDHQRFLERAIEGLTQNGKVICVQLSLFADLIKGKPWSLETLDEVGGTEGLGQVYLEESFSSPHSPPENRYHLKAFQSVLSALLPEIGTDIKGSRQSAVQLREQAGYADRQQDFEDVIRILDGKQRLITPTDSEDVSDGPSEVRPGAAAKYYQLTHDFLVPSLRNWLTQKQKETKSGRAMLRLDERLSVWQSRPENRHLPALFEYLNIRLLTERQAWTEPQRKMMSRAGRVHGYRVFGGVLSLSIIVALGFFLSFQLNRQGKQIEADNIVENLMQSDLVNIPYIIDQIAEFRTNHPDDEYLESQLQIEFDGASNDSPEKLRCALALLVVEEEPLDFVVNRLLDCSIEDVAIIRDCLAPFQAQLEQRLWDGFRNGSLRERFRAGLTLAEFAANDDRWTSGDKEFLVGTMLSNSLSNQEQIRSLLNDLGNQLFTELESAFLDPASESEELGSAIAISEFHGRDLGRLTDLVCVATPEQHAILFSRIESAGEKRNVNERLVSIVRTRSASHSSQAERVALGKKRATAAITLLRLGDREQFWDVFDGIQDPEAMTQFIHRCRSLGIGVEALVDCLRLAKSQRNAGVTESAINNAEIAQFAILLSLGEFQFDDLNSTQQSHLVALLLDWYANDASARVHSATGWLLRSWGQVEETAKIDQTEYPYSESREWFTRRIDVDRVDEEGDLTGETISMFLTFIVVDAGVYQIGAPEWEAERQSDESFQTVTMTKRLAVLDREITRGEYEMIESFSLMIDQWSPPSGDHPMVGASWYEFVGFCRALTEQVGLPESEQCFADPTELSIDDYPRETATGFESYPRNWPVRLDRAGFRLPTEAEWEIFCRAGTETAYSFGNDVDLIKQYGWVKLATFTQDNSEIRKTQIPRSLRPNLYGLFDVHGNAWEWCIDWWGIGIEREAAAVDPFGPPDGSTRAFRGGSWYRTEGQGRSGNRSSDIPSQRFSDRGLRIVFTLDDDN